MKDSIVRAANKLAKPLDIILLPIVYPAALLLKAVRRVGPFRLPYCRKMLVKIGVFPIRNHYYEPQFDYRVTTQPFSQDRLLPGIDWNTDEQLRNLGKLSYAHELMDIPHEKREAPEFYLHNNFFEFGDAEYWYQLIRWKKPKRIIEIGSGYSTLMAVQAIRKNKEESPTYECEHVCIEPYEKPWLESTGVVILREKLEAIDRSLFLKLGEGDILFIDSSHIIRPQGDVLIEYLEILPILAKGVIVHIHDIYSPANYPHVLIQERVMFWNEQYLLEAFLSQNSNWKILGGLNFLLHHYPQELKEVAPFIRTDIPASSFYIQRVA